METLIVQPESKERLITLKAFMRAMKIKFQKQDKPYSPKFISKMQQAEEDVKAGRTTKIKPADIYMEIKLTGVAKEDYLLYRKNYEESFCLKWLFA